MPGKKRTALAKKGQNCLFVFPASRITEEDAALLIQAAAEDDTFSLLSFSKAVIRIGDFVDYDGASYTPALIIERLIKTLMDHRCAEAVVPDVYFPEFAGIRIWVKLFIAAHLEHFIEAKRFRIRDLTAVIPDTYEEVNFWEIQEARDFLRSLWGVPHGQLSLLILEGYDA